VDKDDGASGAFGKNAVASNSLGVIGFIVGTAAGQRNIAACIGYYGAAISIYERWIKRGLGSQFHSRHAHCPSNHATPFRGPSFRLYQSKSEPMIQPVTAP